MTRAITLAEAKSHMRIDSDMTADDDDILRYVDSAQQAAENFCRVSFDTTSDDAVKVAILLHATYHYENREATDNVALGSMLNAFKNLLYPYRDVTKMF